MYGYVWFVSLCGDGGIISYQSAVVGVVGLYLAGWWGDFSCHIGEKSGYELVFMGYGGVGF